ncbi:MAG: hypothetical protein KTR25_18020 [Myxococcales bacterium]|nr:hypothetical protein [Myxococcales bacterium]
MVTLLSIAIGLLSPLQAEPEALPLNLTPELPNNESEQTWDDPEPGSESLRPSATYTEESPSALSWDVLGGGIPADSILLGATSGFSRFAEVHLEAPLSDQFTLGGWVGFDFGYWRPDGADQDASLMFGAAARLSILHNELWSIGVRVSPGFGIRTSQGSGFSLFVPLESRALYAIDDRLLVGAAIDLPLRLSFPSGSPDFVTVPMIVGFAGEFHLMPSLALHGVFGFGPALDSRGVEPSFRATIGMAYRL